MSRAVRTFALEEVVPHTQIPLDLNIVKPFDSNIKEWLKPVIDLTDFYMYPTNGITEGLNYWMQEEHRDIKVDDWDYQWIENLGDGIHYISNPSSIDGNWREIPTDIPVALDLAYVGSAFSKKIPMTDNIEYVFFSLSKCFGLRNIRTGWMFTREPFRPLELLVGSAKYYNYHAQAIAENVIKHFDIDYVPRKLKPLGYTESDVVWLKGARENRQCISKMYF